MTSSRWSARARDGLKFSMAEVGKLIADLAACEAER
jgi:hypothetical protein